jgi:hypothetical protein
LLTINPCGVAFHLLAIQPLYRLANRIKMRLLLH